ncbi:Phospholipase D1 [Schizosaccharomyces pombe]
MTIHQGGNSVIDNVPYSLNTNVNDSIYSEKGTGRKDAEDHTPSKITDLEKNVDHSIPSFPENDPKNYSEFVNLNPPKRPDLEHTRGSSWHTASENVNDLAANDSTRVQTPEFITQTMEDENVEVPPLERDERDAAAAHTSKANRNSARQMWAQLMASVRKFKREDEKPILKENLPAINLFEAAIPASLPIAKHFIRDKSGQPVLPIITDLIKVSVLDVEPKHNRIHSTFTIQVEYGTGPHAIRWLIYRQLRDFINLHSHFLFFEFQHRFSGRRMKLPKFPKEVLPYLVKLRGYQKILYSNPSDQLIDETHSISDISWESHSQDGDRTTGQPRHANNGRKKHGNFWTIQGNTLGVYLQEMIHNLQFFPEVNVLYSFLEFSSLGLYLAGAGTFHGKEGFATLKRNYSPTQYMLCCNTTMMKTRSQPFWIIVSESCIILCDNMLSMQPADVFIWDVDFEITRKNFRKAHSKDTNEKIRLSHHSFKIKNRQKVMKLSVRSGRWLQQFINSVQVAQGLTAWCEIHRFDSFAPVRTNVAVQWMVDARDHMWNVSRAIKNAKRCIMIHGWWLSPELQMRRPYSMAHKWRIDRILNEKAHEGVMVYIMIYRNIDATIPIDSFHTKEHLQSLHPNIYVIRSPSHFRQNALFWAHHEKLVVVDDAITFIGGIDLCFGRYDTPQHILYDDKPVADKTGLCEQTWRGKDYSNARVHDFFDLTEPYKDMYDRLAVPRMGWHDVSMCIIGQPARDAARHFVQRWNYLIQCKKPARKTPLLIPPPDFTTDQLTDSQLTGTCEVQVLRSAGLWSLGLVDTVEQSIQNAYVTCIEKSEHFIYIENQFFVTSTTCEGTTIENRVGDALVERIIRAHKNNEKWRGVIMIPLLPGFEGQIDLQEGGSLRLIVECQYRSICHGEHSIFGRLNAKGIDGSKYLRFYGLRGWAHLGENHELVTEMIYVHAKILIADDRVAVIGSANINERSLLGNRDSEIAAVIRDTLTIDSKMDGKPYKVGKFAHTLRKRLMREHLGLETDVLEQREYNMDGLDRDTEWKRVEVWTPDEGNAINGSAYTAEELKMKYRSQSQFTTTPDILRKAEESMKKLDQRVSLIPSSIEFNIKTQKDKVEFEKNYEKSKKGPDVIANALVGGIPLSLKTKEDSLYELSKFSQCGEDQRPMVLKDPDHLVPEPSRPHCGNGLAFYDDIPLLEVNPISGETIPKFDASSFEDPVCDEFFEDIWSKVASNNTTIYRHIFRCVPDDEMLTWESYNEWKKYGKRFKEEQARWRQEELSNLHETHEKSENDPKNPKAGSQGSGNTSASEDSKTEKPKTRTNNGLQVPDKRVVYDLLRGIRGQLVELPLKWMSTESNARNWLSSIDKIPPLEIYD